MSGIADQRLEERVVERLTAGPAEVSELIAALRGRDRAVLARQEGSLHALLHRLVRDHVIHAIGHGADGGTIYSLTAGPVEHSDPLAPTRDAPAPASRKATRLAVRVAAGARDPADRGRVVADVLAHHAALEAAGSSAAFGPWKLAKSLLARADRGRPFLAVAENGWERVKRFALLEGVALATTLVVLAVLWLFVAEFRVIPSNSMQPTLRPNDRVIVKKLGGREVPERWAVVVFKGSKDVLVKRAVGLPGETVKIENGDILLNGVILVKPDELNEVAREPMLRTSGATEDDWVPVGGTSPVLRRFARAFFADEPRYKDPDGNREQRRMPWPLCHDVYLSAQTSGPATLALEFVTDEGKAANDITSVAWVRTTAGAERVTLRRGGFLPGGTEEVIAEAAGDSPTGPASVAVIDGVLRVDSGRVHVRRSVDVSKGQVRAVVGGGVSSIEIDRDLHYTSDKLAAFAVETPYRVPDGHVLMLGDHSSNSADSRFRDVGPIPLERIIGPVIFRVWPPSRIGPVR